MWAAEKARTEAGIGATVDDGFDELTPIRGIVLEVRVLNDDDVSGAHRQRLANRCALAPVDRLEMEPIDPSLVQELLKQLSRTIRRAVVDDDDFLLKGRRVNLVENELDRVSFVVNRNEHGQPQRSAIEGCSMAPALAH